MAVLGVAASSGAQRAEPATTGLTSTPAGEQPGGANTVLVVLRKASMENTIGHAGEHEFTPIAPTEFRKLRRKVVAEIDNLEAADCEICTGTRYKRYS